MSNGFPLQEISTNGKLVYSSLFLAMGLFDVKCTFSHFRPFNFFKHYLKCDLYQLNHKILKLAIFLNARFPISDIIFDSWAVKYQNSKRPKNRKFQFVKNKEELCV